MLYDTGLFDLSVSADYLSKEIINCLSMAEDGIHAVLFVLSVKNRISQDEESTLNTFQRIFESKILDYFIVVFTGGDELEEDEQTLDDYLREGCPEFLTRVLRLCGGRKVLFNNRTTNKDKKADQLKQLLAHIADVERQTGGKPYTDNMHRKIKEENDKLREIEREAEYKNLAEADIAAMKEKSRMEYQDTMKMMEQMLETALKRSSEAHEREMRYLKDTLQQGQQLLLPPPRLGRLECSIM
ncbi:unnamed protein product [Thlaspi arvense]|uniref:AIG1-type G domain-containing protein n=1 Tax=Thlaspi arvense TaxID=13288 RepID=A0AAU9R7G2_THLAR|nr:unnamed protein product [Thlaspi arvense]